LVGDFVLTKWNTEAFSNNNYTQNVMGEENAKACLECGAMFELTSDKEKSVKERQRLFPDTAEALEQELICCEDCAIPKMIDLL